MSLSAVSQLFILFLLCFTPCFSLQEQKDCDLVITTPFTSYQQLNVETYLAYSQHLDAYLKERGHLCIEGNISSRNTNQPASFIDLLSSNPHISNIAEIGFNAGHSSLFFLTTQNHTTLYSFDIMDHDYVHDAKRFIDEHFPDRHVLIEGDSTHTVLQFFQSHPTLTFDLIFIDGGHQFETALADIQNMYFLAHQNTIAILDDAHPGGPVAKAAKTCEEMQLIKDSRLEISQDGSKAWILYKYNLDRVQSDTDSVTTLPSLHNWIAPTH